MRPSLGEDELPRSTSSPTEGALMASVRRVRDVAGRVSWTVVDASGLPIADADDYIAYLQAIERSPNTQRGYAHDLKHYFDFLAARGLRHDSVTAEDLGYFIQYLRRPDPEVALLTTTAALRSAATVNRAMAAVSGFYHFLDDRDGSTVGDRLAERARVVLHTERAFLDAITGTSQRDPVIGPRLRPDPRHLEVLTITQARAIIDACQSLRDRLFFSILMTTGMRRGQALGLRHSDIDTRARAISIVPRVDNVNGARAKTPQGVTIPISRDLARLYLDYMHAEYGNLDSDYVFVTAAGPHTGEALTEHAVDALVRRLRRRVGFDGWSCHTFRHTWATLHHRAGMRLEIISHLLTHGSVRTTAEIYSHLDADDLRNQLAAYGCWETA